MKTLDWPSITSQSNPFRMREAAIDSVTKLLEDDGTFDLVDCYLDRHKGGNFVIQHLDALANGEMGMSLADCGTYKFKCLKLHDWARPRDPEPGDVYMLLTGEVDKFRSPTTGEVLPMNTREKRRMLRKRRERGDKHDTDIYKRLKLDKDCCVTVDFFTAMNIIVNWTTASLYDEDADRFHFEPYVEPVKRTRKKKETAELPEPGDLLQ